MRDLFPRLFLQHFAGTSLIVETQGGDLVGFVVAFVSQDDPRLGYIHFVGVAPDRRASGLGRELYDRTFGILRSRGCTRVMATTAPINTASVSFHTAVGFGRVPEPRTGSDSWQDYDGAGRDKVVFLRSLA